jgi:TPR repeat
MMRRTEDARQEYQRAIDLNPNFAAAYGYLGFTPHGQSVDAWTATHGALNSCSGSRESALL